ncbi:MAG: MBOAT family protein [Candidatus Omnitrophica bacterium]|nr:MBOAT family protein [Candidatus Omnitrophota bacterium]
MVCLFPLSLPLPEVILSAMIFNSFTFFVFFLVVYALYVLLQKNLRWQNAMLLAASCVFYGAWSWRFLFLMFASISVDYACALCIERGKDERTRKKFVFLSILVNLSVLGFFKYFNFFAGSFQELLQGLGFSANIHALNIILPIGISFYTFEAMSYVIDVYRGKMQPTRNYIHYALFVLYFPHLIAGPIMRAKDLLPQIVSPRTLSRNKIYDGVYLICWGLFKKVAVADNLGVVVDMTFRTNASSGMMCLLALYAFAFQIYCDFSGYSDIARGLGKCMGFEIMINFRLPYLATNPVEFWKRWHISLSSWLRDYLYIPLGGNRKGTFMMYRNLLITMFLGGLWHGANWTFVVWGAYHGLLLVIYKWIEPDFPSMPKIKNPALQKIWHGLKIIFFFNLVCLGWLFFRAENIGQALLFLNRIAGNFFFDIRAAQSIFYLLLFLPLLFVLEKKYRNFEDPLAIPRWDHWQTPILVTLMIFSIIIFAAPGRNAFIYFQF